ncbi:LuxR C-terminal-related transcriptional regulator [Streptomyces sp. NBC_01077]|uniref:LuxR C-terminal-related transcriptional regulator n=1 Tax=Streptomyces sp. NBC_01077 TaxID=2903746 RepID=UPI00386EFDEF|nr:LuxR C-terminal-related transcriptional regulator [Streptomyces sp. NBC_01077]WSV43528.1 LuxR C-terminal-related transcriptional regulator [Streptomyces sp. NBC_01077]
MAVRERGVVRWPLTGREKELQSFAEGWADRRCRGVVICGPAGVGKSRLAEECLAKAVGEGFKGGRATASQTAGTVPLWAIAHLVPDGVDMSDPVKGFAAMARVLAGPQRQRWAFLVDDLQLLDATSAVLLQQLSDAGVVRVIGTIRTGEPLSDAVGSLIGGDAVHRIDLEVFDQQQTEEVLRAALGGPVRRRTLQELYAASGGNSLYLWELVQGALHAGTLVGDPGAWELAGDLGVGTPQLAGLIAARLNAAPPAARPVLELLALAEPLSLADVQSETTPTALTRLEEAGLITVTLDRRRSTVQLAHPLYGEVLREQIPAVRRRSLLAGQVQRVESHGARRRDDPLRLAAAQLAVGGTAAPGLLIQAARLARHAHDYRQVIALLSALEPQQQSSATGLLLGEAYTSLKELDEAEISFARAYETATTEAEIIGIAQARQMNFQTQSRMDDALKVLMQAQDRVEGGTGRKILRVNEGILRCVTGQTSEGLRLLEVMDDLEEDIDDQQALDAWLYAAVIRGATLASAGHPSKTIDMAAKAYETHLRHEYRSLFQQPLFQRIPTLIALVEEGRFSDALSVGHEIIVQSISQNLPIAYLWGAFYTGRCEFIAGHMGAARDLYDEAAAEAHKQNDFFGMRLFDSSLAASTALLGDLPTAQAIVTESHKHPVSGILVGEESLGEAWLHAARNDLGRARTTLLDAAASARETGHVSSEALLLTDVARLGAPRDVAGRLAELAEVCDGTLVPARARFAAALATDDPDLLQAAAGELEGMGADLLAAEAANSAAVAWGRVGNRRRATAAALQSQTCADRCHARTRLLAPAESTEVLTGREKEVAHLAATGVASKDIATALHLSVRTVDNHLQHAYTKLGVTSRRELANTLAPRPRPVDP